MIDNEFTKSIQQWLDTPAEERNLQDGATLLLRLNKNLFMHQRILKREDMALLEYQLKKHLEIRLEGLTIDAVARMDEEVVRSVSQTLTADAPEEREAPEADEAVLPTDADTPQATRRGKRPDHDTLPAEIQSLYERGGELYFKMKQAHATLSTMEDASPCDRYEYCKALKDLHDAYRRGWEEYDNYGTAQTAQLTDEQAKAVGAARKYISTNKAKLAKAEGEARTALLAKMQERIDTLLALSQVFTDEMKDELQSLGLNFNATPLND